jgi:UDP-N-acetylmuramate--alanine ligase
VTVVDDYGHHPTEILATLQAARECGYGRVHGAVSAASVYADAGFDGRSLRGRFKDADTVQVLDIYAASEQPIELVLP